MARRSVRPASEHTILVVDDQQDTLVSVGSLLEREGHRILTAESAEQALEVIRARDVHLVIVDYFMPRMNGSQLVREIRRTDPFVQIILQTGYAGERPPRVMLAELEIQGYHDKSDDPERLLLWVDVALKTHRLLHTIRDREQLQGELVANCSHEFRTPLNIILGYAELLLGGNFGNLPSDATPALQTIDGAARSLLDILCDFLQYAKVEAGVAPVAKDVVDVGELASEMQRLANVLLEDKSVTFVLELDAAPERIVTDAVKLRTILRNLVTNAAKFTDIGTVALRVTQRGGQVRLEVRDSGPGIQPEDQGRVFEAFRQLDGSSTRSHGGLGLGLALARKLARTLGGDLQLQSEYGKGSTFVFSLPADAATRAPAEPPLTTAPPA
jgi:signal transduction histidine kinase